MAVLDALAIKQRHKCFVKYQNLVADVMNLWPYYDFVACTRKLLGPVGVFHAFYPESIDERGGTAGVITIFPRFFGFSIDAAVYGLTKGGRLLQPFHHGVKIKATVQDAYGPLGPEDGSQRCVAWDLAYNQQQVAQILKQSDSHIRNMRSGCPSQVPRWAQPDETCYDKLWCAPEIRVPGLKRNGILAVNGSLAVFEYEDPGRDWYSVFADFR